MSQSWTDPHTFTPGEKPRAADLNILRDDLLFLFDPPRCAVRLSSAKAITSASDTAVIWDQAVWDSTGNMFDPSSPTRVVARRAGIYDLQLSTLWNDDAASGGIKRAAFLHVNGTRRRGFYQLPPSSPSEYSGEITTNLAQGQYLEVFVRHDADDILSLQATRTVLTVKWTAAPPPFGQGE